MKKINVLKKNREFQRVIENKKQKTSKFLIMYFMESRLDYSRIGIAIPKKYNNAVQRNATRRRVRVALDTINPWNIPYNIVIITRRGFLELDYTSRLKEMNKIFKGLLYEQK